MGMFPIIIERKKFRNQSYMCELYAIGNDTIRSFPKSFKTRFSTL